MRKAARNALVLLLTVGVAVFASRLLHEHSWRTDYERQEPQSSPLLRDGARFVDFVLRELSHGHRVHFVEFEGDDHRIEDMDDLRPFLVPITTPRLAGRLVNAARALGLDDAPPGMRHAHPHTGGLSPLFDERMRERGIPLRRVVQVGDRFEVDEPSIVGHDELRLVRLRTTVSRDGTMTTQETEEYERLDASDHYGFLIVR